ncbi:MAG: hypothetical protein Q8R16_04960 [bacterium]|nr:hypothetical protein [bacterium]
MHRPAPRPPTYYSSISMGVAFVLALIGERDWPNDWTRWTLHALAVVALMVAVTLLVIARRTRRNPLLSGSDWKPFPPSAPAFVPVPPRPPTLSGPAAVALPIPREDDDPELAEINRSLRGLRHRQPVGALRALPPPEPEPHDPGVIPFRPRRPRNGTGGGGPKR